MVNKRVLADSLAVILIATEPPALMARVSPGITAATVSPEAGVVVAKPLAEMEEMSLGVSLAEVEAGQMEPLP